MSKALITGASSGLGWDFAKIMASKGSDLILVARRADRLSALADDIRQDHPNVSISVEPLDLSDRQAFNEATTVWAGDVDIDVLINNAGFGDFGAFADMDDTRIGDMISLNCGALTLLSRALLPGFLKRRRGRILNVASTAAFQPGPWMSVYFATKAYVLSFSEALAYELKDTPVTVTALCPGPTKTEFADVANLGHTNLFQQPWVPESRDVAETGVKAMMRGKRVKVFGLANRVGAWSTRFVPRAWTLAIVNKLQAPSSSAGKNAG